MVLPPSDHHTQSAKQKIQKLLSQLGFSCSNIDVFILAFVHRSIVNEKPHITPEHNERLEFLGDAVLELVITNRLFTDYSNKQEWELTDIRSALVRGRNLSQVAKNLHFEEYLFLGKGEENSGGRNNDYILANTLEAFIGALYLDSGIHVATEFIEKYIYTTLPTILEKKLFKDFKTLVQEYAQAEFEITPTYKVLEESGPDHDKNFTVGIYLWEKHIGTGTGSSKKKAQESAAQDGYNTIYVK